MPHLRIVTKTVLGHANYPLERNFYFARPRTCYLDGYTKKLGFPGTCITFYIHCLLGRKTKKYCQETHQQGSTFWQLPDIQIVILWLKTGANGTVLGWYATLLSHSCCGKHRKSVF